MFKNIILAVLIAIVLTYSLGHLSTQWFDFHFTLAEHHFEPFSSILALTGLVALLVVVGFVVAFSLVAVVVLTFIAGGIGITPFITMVNTLKKMGKPFELHYVARCVSRFLPINNYSEKIFLYNSRNEKHAMHVEQLLKGINRSAQIYVCGPLRLIEDVLNTTNKLGWSMQNVHFESFGATSKKADKTIAVKLMQSGISIEVNPGTSILNALLENNIWMPYECLRGECASCAVEVISGEIDHRDRCLTDEQRKHTMCPCVSWANSKNISINL